MKYIFTIALITLLFFSFVKAQQNKRCAREEEEKQVEIKFPPRFDDTAVAEWPGIFKLVQIPSSIDDQVQSAYFFEANSETARPLIVSLHTWSGDFTQEDPLAKLCIEQNLHFIHPDFRGANVKPDACCSDYVISDIDAAISYALAEIKVKPSGIYLIGVSGGGYATLCMLMRSVHPIAKFAAWAPITDLVAWYDESSQRQNKYARDILDCTGSDVDHLNIPASEERSPIYWNSPLNKMDTAHVSLFTGIYDGIRGSVPITHSLNFYNKLLGDLHADSTSYVSDQEKLYLLEKRKPLADYGEIDGRQIFLKKEYKGIKVVVFDGEHEMLPNYALEELLHP